MFPALSLFSLFSQNLCSNTTASTSVHFSTPFTHLFILFAFLSSSISDPSIPKAGQSFLGFQRYKLGADSALFSQEYTDPSQDAAGAPYTSFGGDDVESPGGGGGQANSDGAFDGTGGYQRQDYWDTGGGNILGGRGSGWNCP